MPAGKLVFFSWVDGDGGVHGLLLDASPSRQHTVSAQVTEHPVERGAPATDYIRPMPRRLTVEGFITNTPIGAPPVVKEIAAVGNNGVVLRDSVSDAGGGAGINAEVTAVELFPLTTNATFIRGPRPPFKVTALDFLERFDRTRDSFASLVQAILAGNLFSIATTLADYDNMAAVNMTVNESTTAADALNFSIEFQELRIVSTVIVAVPARQKNEKVGPKPPPNADEDPGKKKALQSTLSAAVSGPDQPGIR
jgi:hypothetical protein